MGTEYIHYAIPKKHSFMPKTSQILAFLKFLYSAKWVAAPDSAAFADLSFSSMENFSNAESSGCYVRTSDGDSPVSYPLTEKWLAAILDRDFVLSWPIENFYDVQKFLNYPLVPCPNDPPHLYYELKIISSADYVYRISELIDPFDELVCRCGTKLEFDPEADRTPVFFYSRVYSKCPNCEREVKIGDLKTIIRDGWTGSERKVSGGATSSFAFAVDCGKAIPDRQKGNIKLQSALLSGLEKAFSTRFYEVRDLY